MDTSESGEHESGEHLPVWQGNTNYKYTATLVK
jgi:hypothetical protein